MAVPAAPAIDPAPSAFDTPVPPPAEDFPPPPPPRDFQAPPPPRDFQAPPPPRDFPPSPLPGDFRALQPRRDFPAPPPPGDFPARPPAADFPAPPSAGDFPARPPADFQGPAVGYGSTPAPTGLGATAPQRALGFPAPAERDLSGPATVPGFPALGSIPDFASAAGGTTRSPDSGTAESSDRGAATGAEDPTQRDMGFAAAPVATDYPSPVKPVIPPRGRSGSGPADDAASVWDLAATDVFPAAPPEPGNDDAPGASES
jgi:hypothetical protein